MQPHTSYLICATSRSGSTLLCEALTSTELAGYPDEYFLPGQSTLRWPYWFEDRKRLSPREYIARVTEIATTPNGVMGAKLGLAELDWLVTELTSLPEFLGLSPYQLLDRLFPNLHIIWITRRDKIRQAVSAWRALQTNRWNSATPWIPSSRQTPRFSLPLINEQFHLIMLAETSWAEFFAKSNVTPFTVVYEDLAMDYERVTRKALQFLGVDPTETLVIEPSRLMKQSDRLNDEWVYRFQRWQVKEIKLTRLLGLPVIVRNPFLLRWYVKPLLARRRSPTMSRLRSMYGRLRS